MHIKLCLTVCQATFGQPLGQDDRFGSRMRHQSLSRGDWVFVCAAAALHLSEAKVGWLLPLPRCIDCGYLTPCYTPSAEHGNAYLHLAGPSLHMSKIIWVSWRWIGWRSRFSSYCFLAAFLHLFQDRLDGGVSVVCFVGLPVSWPAATIADWQVVKMSLCAYQKVGTQGWKALLSICFEAAR